MNFITNRKFLAHPFLQTCFLHHCKYSYTRIVVLVLNSKLHIHVRVQIGFGHLGIGGLNDNMDADLSF
jgi:hypothetical protein